MSAGARRTFITDVVPSTHDAPPPALRGLLVREAFLLAAFEDSDGTMRLDLDDVPIVLAALGYAESEAADLLAQAAEHGPLLELGSLTVLLSRPPAAMTRASLAQAFATVTDKGNAIAVDGRIARSELRPLVMRRLGAQFSPREIDEALDMFCDAENRFVAEDFIAALLAHPSMS